MVLLENGLWFLFSMEQKHRKIYIAEKKWMDFLNFLAIYDTKL